MQTLEAELDGRQRTYDIIILYLKIIVIVIFNFTILKSQRIIKEALETYREREVAG